MPVCKSSAPRCACGGVVIILLVGRKLVLKCQACRQVRGNPDDRPGPRGCRA